MFPDEAEWIQRQLNDLDDWRGGVALDIGAGSKHYRTVAQPHIGRLHGFLKGKGYDVKTLDLESDADYVVDIAETFHGISGFDLVLATNVLEHVTNTEMAKVNIRTAIMDGGYLVVTAPFDLPHHAHPVDNMYRPSVDELVSSYPFRVLDLIAAETITVDHYRPEYVHEPKRKVTCAIFQDSMSLY